MISRKRGVAVRAGGVTVVAAGLAPSLLHYSSSTLNAGEGRPSPTVSETFDPIPGEILVRFDDVPDEARLADVAAVLPEFVRWEAYAHPAQSVARGNTPVSTHPLAFRRRLRIDAAADVAAAAARVAAIPGIAWAEPNGRTHTAAVPADPMYAQQYGPQRIGCEAAWDITAGGSAKVVLAVADTGLNFGHQDLQEHFVWTNVDEIADNGADDDGNGYVDDVRGYDFYNDDATLDDIHGHGTHVAGTAAARLANDKGIAGVAGNVTVMPLKVFSDSGGGTWEAIELAVYYAVDNGATLLNYSGGGYSGSAGLAEAVEYAYARGMTIVAAAGNGDTDQPFYPAAYDPVIAVMGTNRRDNRYSSSNYGAWLDVGAPGVDIQATYVPNTDSYGSLTGTSMASPHVAGVVALLYSVRPDLTVDDVTALLRNTALDLGDPGFDELYGYGRVRADEALAATGATPIPCGHLALFKAVCRKGTVKSKVRLADETYAGHAVLIGINGENHRAAFTRGRRWTKAKLSESGYAGEATVTLTTPAGCVEPIVVNCD
ncbi:MAG: S8 family serine peptidase [Phycisphaerae bacterium]|nr:S8 family serine peptidase [Planctomycetia bacterium]MCL4717538.1 S8 family serine peptidase [Phycisphaerae bacterium]NUQ08443.1 S8 family serine peptidase [Phycisphaerae bacterium]